MSYEIIANDAIVGAVIAAVGGVFAVAIGIGRVGGAAVSAISKTEDQQARKDVRDNMLLACAMVEGVALFAAIIGYLMASGGIDILKGAAGA